MRILLIHPEDSDSGPWRREKWDLVVDLGKAGRDTYDRWSEIFRCPVQPIPRLKFEDLTRIRGALFAEFGRMVDQHRLDWWELISIRFHEHLERLIGLQKFASQVAPNDELVLSRSGFHAQALEVLLGRQLHCFFDVESFSVPRKLSRAASVVSKFRFDQLLQILGDKYDAGYRIRRFSADSSKPCVRPVVLLPTAYVNTSRTELSYASALPDRDFLLVATRQSGWTASPPGNVRVARLASYAPGKVQKGEYKHLLDRWRELQAHLDGDLSILKQLGMLDGVPALLREGLAIRDAWLKVFETEPVSAVLCADDSNPYTHLPLLLARERGLPSVACHHGALDGRYLIKKSHADLVLAKGRMEKDYLVNICGVPDEKVEVAAPLRTEFSGHGPRRKRSIVFFSEPYEIGGGRCVEFYREVLPRLADIAVAIKCEFVVKLHPQESLRERRRFLNAVLTSRQRKLTQMVEGPLSEGLLQETWFAVTVLSTTAVDCTLLGIPVFLCAWLNYSNYGYVEQFIKFGAGVGLRSADEILKIPDMVQNFCPRSTRDLWEPASAPRLERLLSEPLKVAAAV
jgi:hypothetical protein